MSSGEMAAALEVIEARLRSVEDNGDISAVEIQDIADQINALKNRLTEMEHSHAALCKRVDRLADRQ